jgi:hypothetical protein
MRTLHRRSSIAGVLGLSAALALGGIVAAHSLPATPNSDHASATAQEQAADANANASLVLSSLPTPEDPPATNDQLEPADATPDATHPDNHGLTVSTAAADATLVGGAQDSHGGYVSCVARGGSLCDTASPSFAPKTHGPSGDQGASADHSQASAHRQNPGH